MDKESIYELQKIDCNCNNCGYLVRDIEKHNLSKTLHRLWQRQYFDLLNKKKTDKAQWWINTKNDYNKAAILLDEVDAAKFQFKNNAYIQFGECKKFSKEISFIPDTCQLETQKCFVHRNDLIKNITQHPTP